MATVQDFDAGVTSDGRNLISYVDAVTSTFAIVMFGLAIPLNAYVMLKYATAFDFREPALVNAVGWSFPWLPILLAIGIPILAYVNRTKLSGRSKTVTTLLLLVTTTAIGILAFLIVSMPIVTWLNAL